MIPDVRLTDVSREDVERMAAWLENPEVVTMWYGADEDGDPLHIGYSPKASLQASDEEWQQIFNDPDRKIFSVYDANEGHVGEAQMVIEAPLHEAQLFLIIGRQDLWLHHFGSAALLQLLDMAFSTYKLHRAWVDVPTTTFTPCTCVRDWAFSLKGTFAAHTPRMGSGTTP